MTRISGFAIRYGIAATLPLAIAAFLFVGIERRIGEHDDSYNPADCGMCEIPRFEDFSHERKTRFARFCAVRFGIEDIRVCHAIFVERQVIADELAGSR